LNLTSVSCYLFDSNCLIVWVGSFSFHNHGSQGLCEYYLFYPTHRIK
jgi:hypothetical protein